MDKWKRGGVWEVNQAARRKVITVVLVILANYLRPAV